MAYTAADVEEWLGLTSGDLDADLLARIIAAVEAHAARHYDLTDAGDDTDKERDQALIMECARLYQRKHSANGYVGVDELGAVRITQFDPDVRALLAGRLTVVGLFGHNSAAS